MCISFLLRVVFQLEKPPKMRRLAAPASAPPATEGAPEPKATCSTEAASTASPGRSLPPVSGRYVSFSILTLCCLIYQKVCRHMCTLCIHMDTCTLAHVHVHIHIYTCSCTHVYFNLFMHTEECDCLHLHAYTQVYRNAY